MLFVSKFSLERPTLNAVYIWVLTSFFCVFGMNRRRTTGRRMAMQFMVESGRSVMELFNHLKVTLPNDPFVQTITVSNLERGCDFLCEQFNSIYFQWIKRRKFLVVSYRNFSFLHTRETWDISWRNASPLKYWVQRLPALLKSTVRSTKKRQRARINLSSTSPRALEV